MARFYGSVKGQGQLAHRLGGKKSGISLAAASWQGSVSVSLWHDSRNDVDMCEVELKPWQGAGTSKLLYRGPVSGAGLSKNPGEAYHEELFRHHQQSARSAGSLYGKARHGVAAATHYASQLESKARGIPNPRGRRLRQLSVLQLAALWREDSEGEYIAINDSGDAYYIAHGVRGKKVASGWDWSSIRAWMDKQHFCPNIWHINERGNVELYTARGDSLGGLV